MILARWHARAALAALSLLGACGRSPPKLGFRGGTWVYAVGAPWLGPNEGAISLEFFSSTFVCTNRGKLGECHSMTSGSTALITDATVDDPAIFQVVKFGGGAVYLRPLAPGQTTLRVTAKERMDGEPQTAITAIEARVPERLALVAHCTQDRAPAGALAFPTGTKAILHVQVLGAAEVPLHVDALPPIDWGSLTVLGLDPSYGGHFAMPAASTKVHVTSAAFPAFDQLVWAYEAADVTGLKMIPAQAPPYTVHEGNIDVDVALLLGPDVACQESTDLWTKTVTVDAESQKGCDLEYGDSRFEDKVGEPPITQPRGFYPGPCNLTAVSDVTGHIGTLELVFGAKGATDGGVAKDGGAADGGVGDGG